MDQSKEPRPRSLGLFLPVLGRRDGSDSAGSFATNRSSNVCRIEAKGWLFAFFSFEGSGRRQDLVRAPLNGLVMGLRKRGAAGVPRGGKTRWAQRHAVRFGPALPAAAGAVKT